MIQVKRPLCMDISHWVIVPDFEAIDPEPWLVFTKITEGTDFLDAKAGQYPDEIRAAGMRLGGFHFMVPGDEIGQADWFCEVLGAIGLHGDELLKPLDAGNYGSFTLNFESTWKRWKSE